MGPREIQSMRIGQDSDDSLLGWTRSKPFLKVSHDLIAPSKAPKLIIIIILNHHKRGGGGACGQRSDNPARRRVVDKYMMVNGFLSIK